MLYSEFLKGTRAPETPDTYNQFQIIGQIYEDSVSWLAIKFEAMGVFNPEDYTTK